MKTGCDAILRNRKTGRIRRCGALPVSPVGTRRIPMSKKEYKRFGGQPKHFCDEHIRFFRRREIVIFDGRKKRRAA